mgnify:CR=1 FL=1
MQVRASYKGSSLVNEAAGYIAEYAQRKRLAKLGYTSPLGELTAFQADVYAIIDTELDDIQLKESKKHGR